MREKWLETVEYVCQETHSVTREKHKIVMFNGGNGDLYISTCPESHRFGTTVRIERSGGAATRNPRLVQALTATYDAIAGNEDVYFNGIEVGEEVKEDLAQLSCDGVGYDFRTTVQELIRFYKEQHPELNES